MDGPDLDFVSVAAVVSRLLVFGFFVFFELGPRDSRGTPYAKRTPKLGYAKQPTEPVEQDGLGI